MDGMSLRRRPKRRVSVNLHLSKQDLQEYLDDGYTAADIAKDFNVSPAIITEKIRKYGVKKKPTKVVKKRGRPPSPKKQKPSQKQKPRGRPPKKQPSPRKDQSSPKEQGTPSKQDLQNVITQVIQDNPEKAVDHIHDLLSFMGFDLAKSVVEDRIRKLKGDSKPAQEKGQNSSGHHNRAKESCENGQTVKNENPENDGNEGDGSKVTVCEGVDATAEKETDGASTQGEVTGEGSGGEDKGAGTSQGDNTAGGCNGESEPSIPELARKRRPGRPRKVLSYESNAEPVKRGRGRPRKIQSNEPHKEESAKKRGPGRPRKVHSSDSPQAEGPSKRQRRGKSRKINVGDTDSGVNGSDEKNEGSTTKKQGKKPGSKTKMKTMQNGPASKRGRPCLNLSAENLRLCVEMGLPVGKIAEALGACRQSINRYLQVYKMRKTDRFTTLSNEELDKLVSKMCRDHPEWGQVRIQEELKNKGLHFRRAQIRNSVRRVDPVGIELRKLNNLKMRWNRGSLNRLDKILPADGINMTSTESFVSRPPRNGLNGLNEEDSVRLLKSIVTTHRKTYVESASQKLLEQTEKGTTKEESSDGWQEQPVLHDEREKQVQEELMEAAQEVENTNEMREVSREMSDEENIVPGNDPQQDLRIESPEPPGSEDGKEYMYRQMLYNMVMSTQKSDKDRLSSKEDPAVTIPKEELQECLENGFSSSRIADKFGTTIANVRRHITMYKLAMSTRFERISEERIDEIVMDVIREFSIKRGAHVYGHVREKGYRIRKSDIHSSLSRLYPKGLNRKSTSILQQSWEAASKPQPSDVESTMAQDIVPGSEMENGGASETVVMLDSEELAQLINGDGSITVVQQEGSPCDRDGGGLVSREQVTEIANSIANTFVASGNVQQMAKPGEEEISTIIVEIGIPGEGGSSVDGKVVDQVGSHSGNQIAHYDASQQPSQELVVVVADEDVNEQHLSNVIAVNTIPGNNGDENGGLNM